MRRAMTFVFLVVGLCACALQAEAQKQKWTDVESKHTGGTLEDIRYKRTMLLLVSRAGTVDVSPSPESILKEALKSHETMKREPRKNPAVTLAYNNIAKKLNKYITKHKSMTAVQSLGEAEFVVVFNILNMRGFDGRLYPYGEMFVITNRMRGEPERRIVWRTKKQVMWAMDAAGQLVKDMKNSRGEK